MIVLYYQGFGKYWLVALIPIRICPSAGAVVYNSVETRAGPLSSGYEAVLACGCLPLFEGLQNRGGRAPTLSSLLR